MIDPLETVMAFLKLDGELTTLVGDRIAAKRRFGQAGQAAWTTGQTALVVRLNGGRPNIDVEVQEVSIEARCFAGSAFEAMKIWMRLVHLSREGVREPVNTSLGLGLLYSFLSASGPSLLWDPEVGMDFVASFFDATVAEGALA
jgi:hypothetical protein